jgi:hypothetical protein
MISTPRKKGADESLVDEQRPVICRARAAPAISRIGSWKAWRRREQRAPNSNVPDAHCWWWIGRLLRALALETWHFRSQIDALSNWICKP